MRFSVCKNSVFCVLFLLFYFLGTICGVLLLRCLLYSDPEWLTSYCEALQTVRFSGFVPAFLFRIRPFLFAVAAGMSPGRDRLLPVVIFANGCLDAYAVGAFYMTGVSLVRVMIWNILLFPLFFLLCRRIFDINL